MRQTLVPFLQLDSPRDHSHSYRLSRPLDGEAVYNAVIALLAQGHTLGRTRYNHPPEEKWEGAPPILPLTHPIGPGDRVIAASRPPLFEDKEKHPKVMKPGYTELEEPLCRAWLPFFKDIVRTTFHIAPHLHEEFEEGFESRSYVDVGARQGSPYRRLLGVKRPKEPRTCVFLLNLDDFYRGAALTSFFGMDGVSGLVFSLMLRERHPEWLETKGFRMVELVGTKIPPRTDDLSFSDAWEAISILHVAP